MSRTEQQALHEALTTEYSAVYAYGLIAAHANANRSATVAEHTATHRASRDATIDALTAAGTTVPAAAAAYTMPIEVSNPESAAHLAIVVETDTAIAWRAVVESADTEIIRRTAIDALTACATRRAIWQSFRGVEPATTAFPGKP